MLETICRLIERRTCPHQAMRGRQVAAVFRGCSRSVCERCGLDQIFNSEAWYSTKLSRIVGDKAYF